MSQQLVFDISTATARSKGQARRRHQPTLSEDARKAQRNLARRERARCKKTGKAEEQLLTSIQPFPSGRRPQYGFSSPINGKAAPKLPDIPLLPHLPAFTIFAHANNVNHRALAQSSRYIVAQSKAQETRNVARDNAEPVDDFRILQAVQAGSESSITSQEQDLNAAGILFEVARDQCLVPIAMGTGTISVGERSPCDTGAGVEGSVMCPAATCSYHMDVRLWLKKEWDKHIMTHFHGDIFCSINGKCYSFPWPNYTGAPEQFFHRVETLKDLIKKWTFDVAGELGCGICFRGFSPSDYVEHLDDCIVLAVQIAQAGLLPFSHSPLFDPYPLV